MTNQQIIFNESVKLMEAGIIGTTGRSFTYQNQDGEPVTLYEPEPIHTFKRWQELGYTVKKGEHHKARFMIWKAGKSKKEEEAAADGDNAPEGVSIFMKMSCFFTFDQVEKTKEKPKKKKTA